MARKQVVARPRRSGISYVRLVEEWAHKPTFFLPSDILDSLGRDAFRGCLGGRLGTSVHALVQSVVEDVVRGLGYDLYHVESRLAGSKSLLRIYIEKVGGIQLADCETVSRAVGAELELRELIQSAYTLEVSSPGLDRPLFRTEDYNRFIGQTASVRTSVALDGTRTFEGEIKASAAQSVTLRIRGGSDVEIPLRLITTARLVFDPDAEAFPKRG